MFTISLLIDYLKIVHSGPFTGALDLYLYDSMHCIFATIGWLNNFMNGQGNVVPINVTSECNMSFSISHTYCMYFNEKLNWAF